MCITWLLSIENNTKAQEGVIIFVSKDSYDLLILWGFRGVICTFKAAFSCSVNILTCLASVCWSLLAGRRE